MRDLKTTPWYVKTDSKIQGPFQPRELLQQASIGNLLGDSEISADPKGPWLLAETLPALEMDWQVCPENAAPLPRCHVMALRNWVEENTVQPYWDIVHLPTGERYDVVDALCSALLAQNHVLEARISQSQHAAAPDLSADLTPQDVRIQLDHAKKESAKWKRLYDDEIQRNESREQELRQDNETLRDWQRKASERIKALERRQATYDDTRLNANALEDFAGDRDLAQAYQELQLQTSHLLESLQLKSRQLDEAREQSKELKLELRLERQNAEEKVDRVSKLHEDTLDHLNRIEQAHFHLTRSYRELNDRLIQLRNQTDRKNEATKAAAPAPAAMPPPSPASSPAPAPSRPAQIKPGGPTKIKMT